MEPFEEGADRSVRGEETGADLAACGGSAARPSQRGGVGRQDQSWEY